MVCGGFASCRFSTSKNRLDHLIERVTLANMAHPWKKGRVGRGEENPEDSLTWGIDVIICFNFIILEIKTCQPKF